MAELISSREAAQRVGVSRSQVNRDAASGKLPTAVRLEGGARLFDSEVVHETYRKALSA